jgi:voltage-gated potassium channel
VSEAPRPKPAEQGGERAAVFARRFAAPMFVAALLVIPSIVIDVSRVGRTWKAVGTALNWVVWVAFFVELVTMLAVTRDRATWLRRHPLEVAIVIFTPPFLPASLQALRLLRLLRLFRVAIVVKNARRLFSVEGLELAAVIAAVTVLAGGALFSSVEKHHSLWDGVWWAVATMSTVGYGDLAPRTVAGRLDAVVLMLVGIGFFALLTGAVAQRFVAAQVHEEVVEAEAEIVSKELSAREEIIHELRAISSRLQELEQVIEKL